LKLEETYRGAKTDEAVAKPQMKSLGRAAILPVVDKL
jgi:hypothetical protein